jgi:Protein of unknown function (DUF3618)
MTTTDHRPDEVERDIDQTRTRLDRNVEELQDRLSPSGIADEAAQYLRDGGEAVGRGLGAAGANIGRTVRDNPVPTVLICAGLAWLAVDAARGHGSSSGDGGDDRRSSKVRDAAGRVGERLETGAAQTADRVREAADTIADKAHAVREHADEYGTQARDTAVDVFDRQPMLVGLLGVAVGAAIGFALPHTHREDRVLGPYRDDVGDRMRGYGREQAKRAERVADAAVSAARDELADDDTDPQNMVEQHAASRVTEKLGKVAKAAAQAATDEAKKTSGDGAVT